MVKSRTQSLNLFVCFWLAFQTQEREIEITHLQCKVSICMHLVTDALISNAIGADWF